jgi:two-component system response regulator WspF
MRVAIVNDLHVARMALKRVVQSVSGHEVAWQACDGAEAIRRARLEPPDVILMDLIMPNINGVEATRQIMQQNPCPILIVTASVQDHLPLVVEAMTHGALDAVDTPVLADGKIRSDEPLLARLARVERSLSGKEEKKTRSDSSCIVPPSSHGQMPTLLALGASTGGPGAIAEVLQALPATFRDPVVVIQHMRAEFVPGLVVWLQGRCKLPVRLATEGQAPPGGVVSVAATDDHLVLTSSRRFAVVREPADYPFRPSVNAFFESLAAHWPGVGVAVLLTGMGNDGAGGLSALRQSGWFTVAQDEESSVVYGMPKAAAELHAASRVLPLEQIGGAILTRFEGRR